MTFLDNGTMNHHLIPGPICRFSVGWERQLRQCLFLQTCCVPRAWRRWRIKRGAPSRTTETWNCSPQCTSSTNGSSILSSSWPSLSFDVGANQVFCRVCGYIPHVCRNRQWWTYSNAAQFAGFTISISIGNYTHSGQDQPKSNNCKPCSNNSEVRGIERAAAGICTSSLVWAQLCTVHIVSEYGSCWLWDPCDWSPATLWSRPNEGPARLDESTQHHNIDDLPYSGVLWGPYKAADGEWRHLPSDEPSSQIVKNASSMYASLDIQPM